MTATLVLTDEQIVTLFQQLAPRAKRSVLYLLAEGAEPSQSSRFDLMTDRFRRSAAERGLDWDQMSEDEREQSIDDLVHEDR